MDARTILARFTLAFSSHAARHGHRVTRWPGAAKFTANMLARTGPTGNLLLYAKVRSKVDTHEQAFWGLNIAQLASLKAAHLPWWVALPPRPRRDRLSLARAVRAPRNHPSCVVPR